MTYISRALQVYPSTCHDTALNFCRHSFSYSLDRPLDQHANCSNEPWHNAKTVVLFYLCQSTAIHHRPTVALDFDRNLVKSRSIGFDPFNKLHGSARYFFSACYLYLCLEIIGSRLFCKIIVYASENRTTFISNDFFKKSFNTKFIRK